MNQGIITFYNPEKAFGFVRETNGHMFFFHITNFVDRAVCGPVVGAAVEFVVGPPVALGKKPQALNVRYPQPKQDSGETDTESQGGAQ